MKDDKRPLGKWEYPGYEQLVYPCGSLCCLVCRVTSAMTTRGVPFCQDILPFGYQVIQTQSFTTRHIHSETCCRFTQVWNLQLADDITKTSCPTRFVSPTFNDPLDPDVTPPPPPSIKDRPGGVPVLARRTHDAYQVGPSREYSRVDRSYWNFAP